MRQWTRVTSRMPFDLHLRFPRSLCRSCSYGQIPGRRRPYGENGGGRERPPLFAARCGRGGAAQLTLAQHPLGGVAPVSMIPGGKATNNTRGGQDGTRTPDIHEARLKTLRRRALERLRRRHSCRCPHCAYQGGCPIRSTHRILHGIRRRPEDLTDPLDWACGSRLDAR